MCRNVTVKSLTVAAALRKQGLRGLRGHARSDFVRPSHFCLPQTRLNYLADSYLFPLPSVLGLNPSKLKMPVSLFKFQQDACRHFPPLCPRSNLLLSMSKHLPTLLPSPLIPLSPYLFRPLSCPYVASSDSDRSPSCPLARFHTL
jgi:hypothetical protein